MTQKLAILPLSDSSADRQQRYFGEGIADELLHALSWAEDLQVAPLTSSMRFNEPDRDVKDAARQLGVQRVVHGSAHHADGQVNISARLDDIAAGKTLWQKDYAEPLGELVLIEDDILRNITQALGIAADIKQLSVQKGSTENVEAYDFYLQGLSFFRRYAVENIRKALEMFQSSLKADPNFARAWARLAECYAKYFMYHDSGNKTYIERAGKASDRAVAIAPDFSRAHVARGIAWLMEKEFMKAEDSFERAVALNPRNFDALFWHARCCFQQGRLKKAIELFEKAAEVQPGDYQTPLLLRQTYLSLGRIEQASEVAARGIELAKEHLKLNRKDARAIYLACGSMIQLGQYDEALQWADRALAINPDDPMINYNVACCFAQVGETDRALDCLDKAKHSGMVNAGWLRNDADLVSLHDHPRWAEILAELGE